MMAMLVNAASALPFVSETRRRKCSQVRMLRGACGAPEVRMDGRQKDRLLLTRLLPLSEPPLFLLLLLLIRLLLLTKCIAL